MDGQTGVGSVGMAGGEIKTLWRGAETISPGGFNVSLSLTRDGRTSAVVRQSYAQPPEVWAGPLGEWKQITHRNAGLHPVWGEAKSLHWTTDIGTVQGWLVYPRDFDPAKRYPLVLAVHGGPASSVTPRWPSAWSYADALAGAGYFVLQPNPRGSYGAGREPLRARTSKISAMAISATSWPAWMRPSRTAPIDRIASASPAGVMAAT